MNYFAYGRISRKKLNENISKNKQLRALIQYMSNYGYTTSNTLRGHLFSDSWLNYSSKRPNYNKLMNVINNDKHSDTIIFDDLSSIARTLNGLNKFIQASKQSNNIIYILNGKWTFNPNDLKHSDYQKFDSLIKLRNEILSSRMNEARMKAHKTGGIRPRFYGSHRRYYLHVYKYLRSHTLKDTAIKYHMSVRTAYRIKHSGKMYFQLKQK